MRRSVIAILSVLFLFSVTSIRPSLSGEAETSAESVSSLAKKRIELFKTNIEKALAAKDELAPPKEGVSMDDLFIWATVNPEEAGRRIRQWMSTNDVVEFSDAINAIDSALLIGEQFAREVILAVSQKKFQRNKAVSHYFRSPMASELEPEACFKIFNAIIEQEPGISRTLYKCWETGFAKKDVGMAAEAAKKVYPKGLPKNYPLGLAAGMARGGNLAEACAIIRKYSSDSDNLSGLLNDIFLHAEKLDDAELAALDLDSLAELIPEGERPNFFNNIARSLQVRLYTSCDSRRDKIRDKVIKYYRKCYPLGGDNW